MQEQGLILLSKIAAFFCQTVFWGVFVLKDSSLDAIKKKKKTYRTPLVKKNKINK